MTSLMRPFRSAIAGSSPDEPDFIELPDDRNTRSKPAIPHPTPRPPGRTLPADSHSWIERVVRRLTGEEGAGYGTSLILHLILLALLAVPIIHESRQGAIFTTIVTEADPQDDLYVEAPLDTRLSAAPAGDGSTAQIPLQALQGEKIVPITKALMSDQPATAGEETSDATGAGQEALKLFEPENAVKAGSFSAWTTPYAGRRFGETFQPGDMPRPGQAYRITIQIRVPPGRKSYPLGDLSGEVVGTDGYTQIIPAKAYVVNSAGNLVKPRGSLRVVEGVVQIVFLVPGAGALVKDVILVKSKMLDEEQQLELVFTPD